VTSPLGFSPRRACALLDQPRSTQRYARKDPGPEREQILSPMRELVAEHPRFGYRRVAALLRQEGLGANPKRTSTAYGSRKATRCRCGWSANGVWARPKAA
jgi:hypothetical protein